MASTGMIEKQRKRRFKRLFPGLLMEMDKLSALSGVKVCVIIQVPGDTRPTMWSSPVVTEQQLLDRLHSMHQTYDDCKPLSFSELRELERLLCYHTEKLIASLEKKISQSEKVLAHNPPPSPMSYLLHNGIDSGANIDGKVLKQQSLLDLTKQFDQLAIDSGSNTDGQVSRMVCAGNSRALIGGNDSGSAAFPLGSYGGLIGGNGSGSGEFSPGSCDGCIGGNDSGSGAFPPGSAGGVNGESDDSGMLSQANHGSSSGEKREI